MGKSPLKNAASTVKTSMNSLLTDLQGGDGTNPRIEAYKADHAGRQLYYQRLRELDGDRGEHTMAGFIDKEPIYESTTVHSTTNSAFHSLPAYGHKTTHIGGEGVKDINAFLDEGDDAVGKTKTSMNNGVPHSGDDLDRDYPYRHGGRTQLNYVRGDSVDPPPRPTVDSLLHELDTAHQEQATYTASESLQRRGPHNAVHGYQSGTDVRQPSSRPTETYSPARSSTPRSPTAQHERQEYSTQRQEYSTQQQEYSNQRQQTQSPAPQRPEHRQRVPSGNSRALSPQTRADAGSVSKDLDKLLTDLSSFRGVRLTESPTGEITATWSKSAPLAASREFQESDLLKRKNMNGHAAPSPRGAELDTMLSSLNQDMSSKHGIQTVPKGDCAACSKTIVGQVIIALGKMFHPEHFVCCHCGEELGHRNFFERAQKAYCENDYHNLFSPRCAYCNGAIKDKCVTALDRTWHADHFFCAHCGKDFGEDGFHEREGKAYCRQDFFALFAPRCQGCTRAISNNFITALNTHWHPECFVCQECKTGFAAGAFFEHNGKPYCETHYHGRQGTLCHACDKPINGRCVSAMTHKFHPEHFVCSFCRRELTKGTFKEHEAKPYCHKCFGKLLQ